jgi:hypothetical protein
MSLCLKLYERVKQSSEAQLAQRMGVLEQLDEAWSNSKLVLITCLDFDDEPNFLDLWGTASMNIKFVQSPLRPPCIDISRICLSGVSTVYNCTGQNVFLLF